MIKLILCDIDGTLLRSTEKALSEKVCDALCMLYGGGRKIAFASGRSYYSIRSVVKRLPFADDAYYICAHGALCIHRGKLLYGRVISAENIIKFSRYPLYAGMPTVFYSDRFAYVLSASDAFISKLKSDSIDEIVPIKAVHEIKAPVYRIGVYSEEGTPKEFTPHPFDLRVCYTDKNWIEYVSAYADKSVGVSDIQARLYITKQETACLGDGENDLEMFEKAVYTLAPIDADERILKKANVVYDDVAAALKTIENK